MLGKEVYHATYSIVARDPETGQMGVAAQTGTIAVGSAISHIEAEVGAIAAQARMGMLQGPKAMALLRDGHAACDVIDKIVSEDEGAFIRQYGVVDKDGNAAAYTGERCIPYASHHVGDGYTVQANMMLNATVVEKMAEAYENATGTLAERMLQTLFAAEGQGGDIRGMQSASIKIVRGHGPEMAEFPAWFGFIDIRVDDHKDPLKELERILQLKLAVLYNHQGTGSIFGGNQEEGLKFYEEARCKAPDWFEIAYWQAITLLDAAGDAQKAAEILAPGLEREASPENWIELLRRLEAVGGIRYSDAVHELIALLE